MQKNVVFPGTFDPITRGHQKIIEKISKIFSSVIIGVCESKHKNTLFDLDERIAMVQTIVNNYSNITVKPYTGLLVEFLMDNQAEVIIRGVRNVSDFEYEVQLSEANKKLLPSIETLYLAPGDAHLAISSSIVKDIARHKGAMEHFVSAEVSEKLKEKLWP